MAGKEAESWLPVSVLEKGFNKNKLPAANELADRKFQLFFADGRVVNYAFQDLNHLTEIVKGGVRRENYEAIQEAPGIYFVDFVRKGQPRRSVTMCLNLNTGQALVIDTTVPTWREVNYSFLNRMSQGLDLSPIKAVILQASINKPQANTGSTERTEDLVGRRVQYIYSRQHTYEHVYLNRRFYAWQCLKGPEMGIADADICDYVKIASYIYLFLWREKVVPTVGIVIINFRDMRSNGKIFGLDIPSGKLVNFTMGAYAQPINETDIHHS
jgi:hypothetical protein